MTDSVVDGHGPDPAHPPGPELERLTEAVRRIGNQIVLTAATPQQLTSAAEQIEAVADALAPATPPWSAAVRADFAHGDPQDFFPFSPLVGRYNPLAPPIRVWAEDGVVRGTVNLDAVYEGPPGCVHGGVIAAVFDELLSLANLVAQVGAMTGTLTIRYRSPTPLRTDLTLTARHVGVDGRKVRAEGTIHAGDRLCAECEGIFVMANLDLLSTINRGGDAP